MVYNGAKSGLNEVMWYPNFPVPNAEQLIRMQEPCTWNLDLDVSDHFLNFTMPNELRSSVGIDLTPIFKENSKSYMRRRWNRLMMSLTYHYTATQGSSIVEEFIRGDEKEIDNPLRWDSIIFNLPGKADYNTDNHRVYKWNNMLNK